MASVDESTLYTGIDKEPDGMFGNEVEQEAVKEKKQEQQNMMKELLPKLQELIDVIDSEIVTVNSIKRFRSATMRPEQDIRAELQASALYEEYLNNLKLRFVVAMEKVSK